MGIRHDHSCELGTTQLLKLETTWGKLCKWLLYVSELRLLPLLYKFSWCLREIEKSGKNSKMYRIGVKSVKKHVFRELIEMRTLLDRIPLEVNFEEKSLDFFLHLFQCRPSLELCIENI